MCGTTWHIREGEKISFSEGWGGGVAGIKFWADI
jgi:hypothetical protein